MTNCTTETIYHLFGEWTISGVDDQFRVLSETLQEMASGPNKLPHVDCGNICSFDMSGLQLLHVWLECAKMQGIIVQLVNLPDSMQQTIRRLGFGHAFHEISPGTV